MQNAVAQRARARRHRLRIDTYPRARALINETRSPPSYELAAMHRRVAALCSHVRASPTASLRIAEGDYERSEHKLKPGDTVVVTGAAGFVGGWLVTYCLKRGYSVRACVRNVDDDSKTGFMKAMPEYGTKLSLHAADMTVEHACEHSLSSGGQRQLTSVPAAQTLSLDSAAARANATCAAVFQTMIFLRVPTRSFTRRKSSCLRDVPLAGLATQARRSARRCFTRTRCRRASSWSTRSTSPARCTV
eukprot:COSAG02_NODE_12123_length_1592_cov_1.694575_2_plen_247_part_00